MKNDEIEPVRSAATGVAGVIVYSFVVTHSVIVTVIVAVSVLVVALSRVGGFAAGLETVKDLEAGFHDDAYPAAYLMEGEQEARCHSIDRRRRSGGARRNGWTSRARAWARPPGRFGGLLE